MAWRERCLVLRRRIEHPAAGPHALEIHYRLGKYRKSRRQRTMRPSVQVLTERYLELVVDPAGLRIPLPGIAVLSGNERRRLDVLEILQAPRINFADRHGGDSMPSKKGQPKADDSPNATICPRSSACPPLACSRGFFGRGRAPRCAFGANGFCRRGGTLCRTPPRRGALRLPRQPFPRYRSTRFAFESLRHRARSPLTGLGLADPLTGFIGVFRTLARPPAGLPSRWRWQVDARASCLGKPDGDRLLGRACAVLAVADFVDLFPNELAGLGGRGFAHPLVALGFFDDSLERHIWFLDSPRRDVNAATA